MSAPNVLIIEDEEGVRTALARRLEMSGCQVETVTTGAEGLERLAKRPADLVLLDYRLPDTDGLEVLGTISQRWPETYTIVMTAYTNVDLAIRAVRLGAYDYVSKPFSLDEMMVVIDKALEAKRLRTKVDQLSETQRREFSFERVVATDPRMLELLRLIKNVAASEARTILLQGESGTGKDLLAKVIHYNSPRADQPFMNITCTALPETLLESELFGHQRGAFTDARQTKRGLFELADGGTIFLDEIGDMPPSLQAKLLRFLEEKTFRRVGGTRDIVVDVRIVAATNKNLRALVAEGRFREDLFYRLNIFPLTLPPLRDRPRDIPALADHFVRQFNAEFHKDVTGIDPAALALMQAYPWPGNVREMRNVIERAMLLTQGGRITVDSLPPELLTPAVVAGTDPETQRHPLVVLGPHGVDIHEVERRLVEQALEQAGGNQSRAAGLLGLSRDQFRYRLQKFGLLKPGAAKAR